MLRGRPSVRGPTAPGGGFTEAEPGFVDRREHMTAADYNAEVDTLRKQALGKLN